MDTTTFAIGDRYRGYLVTKSLYIQEQQCHLTELVHESSGACILHLGNQDPENLFSLSFRTLPESSNGVAHILEHTVLCGSQKYPVKDPFFAMNRRSLNTFMNALTGADFTCYPAASQVEQDFYNLLDVYLDAVFHPLLKEQSFAQEGCRLEFSDPLDPTSPLQYKGVVYNEMKGSLSSPMTRLIEALNSELYPNSPYGFNSGGDPSQIPNLSYEELLFFHKNYYHPSRCLFFFYGNLPLKKHLDYISHHILKNVHKLPELPPIPKQPRYTKPVYKEAFYPLAAEEITEDKAIIAFSWLTCSIKEQITLLALSVLDIVFMDTDASLLKIELLRSGL
jgi:presequence protease